MAKMAHELRSLIDWRLQVNHDIEDYFEDKGSSGPARTSPPCSTQNHGGQMNVDLKTPKTHKVWGYEQTIVNGAYCGKRMFLREGFRCSIHHHRLKDETFYVRLRENAPGGRDGSRDPGEDRPGDG
jgi:hypothetical protein